MSLILQSILLGISLILAHPAYAQMGLEGFSSGRYEVRKPKQRRPASESENKVYTNNDDEKAKALRPDELVVEEKTKNDAELVKNKQTQKVDQQAEIFKTDQTQKSAQPEKLKQDSAKQELRKLEPPKGLAEVEMVSEEKAQEPSLQQQAESLFSNKTEDIYEFYREQVHPEDSRNNRVELEVNPLIAYMDSQSNYSFRDYTSLFNGFKIKSNIWFTPRIGVTGQILSSLAADVDSVNADRSRIPVKFEFFDLGLNFRTFFGVSRKASSVEFSLLYNDDKMTVPNTNTSRARLKTSGLGVAVKNRIPSSANYAWVVGGSFFPSLQHIESETGAAVTSGTSQESARLGVEFGGEWKFSKENQILWNLNSSVERNIFDGAAQSPDPSTGLTPSNVSVTNALYMFSLGYRWGH